MTAMGLAESEASPMAAASLLPCLLFHPREPPVVVRELVQMCECDLARHNRIVIGHVRNRIVAPVLELDVHAFPKLVDLEGDEGQSIPISSPTRRASSVVNLVRWATSPSWVVYLPLNARPR